MTIQRLTCLFEKRVNQSIYWRSIPPAPQGIEEAHGPTRKRIGKTQQKYQEDCIAGKGFNSLGHYILVHKFIPVPRATKMPEAKAAVGKEWGKARKNASMANDESQEQEEVIQEVQKEGRTVHFATLMGRPLKSSELDQKFHKYVGRVVLRGDIVKDDSGSYAVCAEQGSSAANDGRKSHGCHCKTARMRKTSS